MRKITLMLALVMSVFTAMTSCAKKKGGDNAEQQPQAKTLVAYFSATGTTAEVAKMVAKATKGELYEIEPQQKYSAADLDWTVKSSRCSRENDNPASRPGIKMAKADLDGYDVIYLGYPNWWNMAPRIINTFVEAYNLKGKTVVPFMTSGGSGVENSVSLLKAAYPDVNWQPGGLLNGVSQADVDRWVAGK